MTDDHTHVTVALPPDDVAALDAWIARSADPAQDRACALREIVSGALGSRYPSTVIPNFITGRDIV